jgi:tripartite-type tricarboxylate transporter receptor subunit TctC
MSSMLSTEINAALADAKIKARLAAFGGIGLWGWPADFGGLLAEETKKWAKVVKFAGTTLEQQLLAGKAFQRGAEGFLLK